MYLKLKSVGNELGSGRGGRQKGGREEGMERSLTLDSKGVFLSLAQDAHSIVPDFEKDTAFFAVYDGHGGMCT